MKCKSLNNLYQFISVWLFLVFSFGCISSQTARNEQPLIRENIEWVRIWIPNANVEEKPRVLIVGDSITVGYFPAVEKRLEEIAYCARLSTSRCVCDPVFFEELILVLKQYPFDVIHFNNGLHGFGYTEEQYESGLKKLISVLDQYAGDAQWIWAYSTPMRNNENLDELDPKNERVIERNRIAASIVEAEGIPVTDLYQLSISHPEHFSNDGVHFNNTGKEAQAELVAQRVRKVIEDTPSL